MSEYLGGNYKDFSEAVEREIKMRDDKLRGEMFLPLDIDNLPDKFFTREDIEIENRWKEGEWFISDNSEPINRCYIIENISREKEFEYRYRIIEKKLEPIRITNNLYNLLNDMDIYIIQTRCSLELYNTDNIISIDGREVQIIKWV